MFSKKFLQIAVKIHNLDDNIEFYFIGLYSSRFDFQLERASTREFEEWNRALAKKRYYVL